MALANELGLTSKVVSERHYFASQTNFTAGQAAKFMTNSINKKLSAKDVKLLSNFILKMIMDRKRITPMIKNNHKFQKHGRLL